MKKENFCRRVKIVQATLNNNKICQTIKKLQKKTLAHKVYTTRRTQQTIRQRPSDWKIDPAIDARQECIFCVRDTQFIRATYVTNVHDICAIR